MTRICVLSHSVQHSPQMRASMSAPSEPGSPTFPALSRSCPQRAQTTIAIRYEHVRERPHQIQPIRPIGPYRKSARPRTLASGTGPKVRLSVLSSGRSPSTVHVPPATPAIRLSIRFCGSRGSRTRTISPTRGGRESDETTIQSPAQSAGSMLRPVTATRWSKTGLGPGRGRLRDSRRLGAACLGPDVRDLVDHVEKGLGVRDVERALDLRALLGRLPAELGDLGVLLNVLGLEVVAPEDVDVVLRELGPLLFDDDGSRLELLVARRVVLLDDLVDGLRLDTRLLGVIDTARQVAVGGRGDSRLQKTSQEHDGIPHSLSRVRSSTTQGLASSSTTS